MKKHFFPIDVALLDFEKQLDQQKTNHNVLDLDLSLGSLLTMP